MGDLKISAGSPGRPTVLNEDEEGLEPMRATQALQDLETERVNFPEGTETPQIDDSQIIFSPPNPKTKTSIEHPREGEGKKRPTRGKSNVLAPGGTGLGRIRKVSIRKGKNMGTCRKVGKLRKHHTMGEMEASDLGTTTGRNEARIIIDLTHIRTESMEFSKCNEYGEDGEAVEEANGGAAPMDTQRDTSISPLQETQNSGELHLGALSNPPFQYISYDTPGGNNREKEAVLDEAEEVEGQGILGGED